MKAVFGDAFYFFAMLNPDDGCHDRAVSTCQQLQGRLVTTTWVLTEVAAGLCKPPNRRLCYEWIQDLRGNPNVVIVEPDLDLFDSGLELFSSRIDKN